MVPLIIDHIKGKEEEGMLLQLQQDNVSPHSVAATQAMLLAADITPMFWPPNSLDLNSIENV